MKFSSAVPNLVAALALVIASTTVAIAQQERGEQLSEPVFRVAHETPAKTVSARAVPVGAMAADDEERFFDLTRQQGEHPLAPCKRFAERVLAHIDANISDYSCLFAKLERIDGELQEAQYIEMEASNAPYSVHLLFKKPKKGQECLYVEGMYDDKMKARANGWRGTIAGVLTLDPNGSLAMDGQRHPITKSGIRNLTKELIRIAENDMKFGESEVNTYPDVKLGKGATARPAVMLEIVHPVPRREFKFHISRIYIDKEMRIPVRFEAYNWNKDAKGKPELEELYMYKNVKLNNGYAANYFRETNPEFFQ